MINWCWRFSSWSFFCIIFLLCQDIDFIVFDRTGSGFEGIVRIVMESAFLLHSLRLPVPEKMAAENHVQSDILERVSFICLRGRQAVPC